MTNSSKNFIASRTWAHFVSLFKNRCLVVMSRPPLSSKIRPVMNKGGVTLRIIPSRQTWTSQLTVHFLLSIMLYLDLNPGCVSSQCRASLIAVTVALPVLPVVLVWIALNHEMLFGSSWFAPLRNRTVRWAFSSALALGGVFIGFPALQEWWLLFVLVVIAFTWPAKFTLDGIEALWNRIPAERRYNWFVTRQKVSRWVTMALANLTTFWVILLIFVLCSLLDQSVFYAIRVSVAYLLGLLSVAAIFWFLGPSLLRFDPNETEAVLDELFDFLQRATVWPKALTRRAYLSVAVAVTMLAPSAIGFAVRSSSIRDANEQTLLGLLEHDQRHEKAKSPIDRFLLLAAMCGPVVAGFFFVLTMLAFDLISPPQDVNGTVAAFEFRVLVFCWVIASVVFLSFEVQATSREFETRRITALYQLPMKLVGFAVELKYAEGGDLDRYDEYVRNGMKAIVIVVTVAATFLLTLSTIIFKTNPGA